MNNYNNVPLFKTQMCFNFHKQNGKVYTKHFSMNATENVLVNYTNKDLHIKFKQGKVSLFPSTGYVI